MLTLDEDDPFCVEKFPLCQGFKRWFITKYTVGLNGWMGKFGLENVLVIDMNDDEMTNAKKIISHVKDILPYDEYPWRDLEKEGVVVENKNPLYPGRESAYTHYPHEIEWLKDYFKEMNIEIAELIGEDFPLKWNEIP
jgi:hypothetical protein